MNHSIYKWNSRRYALLAMLAFALMSSGCKKSADQSQANNPPSSPAQAAPADNSAPAGSQPQPADQQAASAPTPAAPPVEAAPVPPPPPEPITYTIPAGTPVTVRLGQRIGSKTASVGDTFTGSLVNSLRSQGVKVVPAGATCTGTVVAAKGQGKFKGEGSLAIQLSEVGGHHVVTSAYLQETKGKGKRSAVMVGGGAGGGALIGGLAGGGKGALIGGLVGAGAGTAGAAFTGNKETVIPAEQPVTFTLQSAISVTQ